MVGKKKAPEKKAKPAVKAPAKNQGASNVPKALAAKVEKAAKHIDGKFCYGLPHYGLSVKLKFDLVELGDRDLFEENEVDADEWTGWIPFAHLAKEPQFLAIHTEAPYRVGMWEHEDGKIHEVWASLDDFMGCVLETKKDKTPYELIDKVLDKASKLVDDDQYGDALGILEPAIKKLPTVSTDKHDDQLARLNNLWGLSLKGVKRYEEAMAAFERAATAGEDYAQLNIMDMLLETMHDPKRAMDRAIAMREKGWLSAYERTWVAIYIAKASLDLGDPATAEKELRDIVERYEIKESELVKTAREKIVEYVKEEKPGAAAAQGFLAWLEPKSYEVSPGDANVNRAWWNALPPKMGEKLFDEVKIKGNVAEATDAQIAQCLDTEECDLREDKENPIMDLTPFLRLTNANRISFYGDPDSIEPLRALPKLERLTINNVVIKEFKWPSRVQRDLWNAAEKVDKAGMVKALAAGADINMNSHDWGKTAFHLIPWGDENKPLACWLVEQGADPNKGNHGDGNDDPIAYWPDALKAKAVAAMKKFGFPPREESPWREFNVGRMPKCANFEAPKFRIEGKDFDDGDSLVSEWPNDVKLQMEPPKKDEKIYDIMRVGYDDAVVSEKAAEVLRADQNIELLPVTLIRHDKKPVPGTWYFVNPLAKNCFIVEKCGFQWNHIDPESASAICSYAIDASKVGDAQMFRPTIVNSRPMIVTKAMAEKLTAAFGENARITILKR